MRSQNLPNADISKNYDKDIEFISLSDTISDEKDCVYSDSKESEVTSKDKKKKYKEIKQVEAEIKNLKKNKNNEKRVNSVENDSEENNSFPKVVYNSNIHKFFAYKPNNNSNANANSSNSDNNDLNENRIINKSTSNFEQAKKIVDKRNDEIKQKEELSIYNPIAAKIKKKNDLEQKILKNAQGNQTSQSFKSNSYISNLLNLKKGEINNANTGKMLQEAADNLKMFVNNNNANNINSNIFQKHMMGNSKPINNSNINNNVVVNTNNSKMDLDSDFIENTNVSNQNQELVFNKTNSQTNLQNQNINTSKSLLINANKTILKQNSNITKNIINMNNTNSTNLNNSVSNPTNKNIINNNSVNFNNKTNKFKNATNIESYLNVAPKMNPNLVDTKNKINFSKNYDEESMNSEASYKTISTILVEDNFSDEETKKIKNGFNSKESKSSRKKNSKKDNEKKDIKEQKELKEKDISFINLDTKKFDILDNKNDKNEVPKERVNVKLNFFSYYYNNYPTTNTNSNSNCNEIPGQPIACIDLNSTDSAASYASIKSKASRNSKVIYPKEGLNEARKHFSIDEKRVKKKMTSSIEEYRELNTEFSFGDK